MPTDQRADTRSRITTMARSMANRDGIDVVTTRAVAAQLGISPGNVSYHFPRREDLLLALADDLSLRNDDVWSPDPATCAGLLDQYRAALWNQWAHRGVVMALPSLMERHPDLRRRYAATEAQRYGQQRRHLEALVARGALDLDAEHIEQVLAQIVLVVRWSWLNEYRVTRPGRGVGEVIDHYLAMIAAILHPHATDAGRDDLTDILRKRLPNPG